MALSAINFDEFRSVCSGCSFTTLIKMNDGPIIPCRNEKKKSNYSRANVSITCTERLDANKMKCEWHAIAAVCFFFFVVSVFIFTEMRIFAHVLPFDEWMYIVQAWLNIDNDMYLQHSLITQTRWKCDSCCFDVTSKHTNIYISRQFESFQYFIEALARFLFSFRRRKVFDAVTDLWFVDYASDSHHDIIVLVSIVWLYRIKCMAIVMRKEYKNKTICDNNRRE